MEISNFLNFQDDRESTRIKPELAKIFRNKMSKEIYIRIRFFQSIINENIIFW